MALNKMIVILLPIQTVHRSLPHFPQEDDLHQIRLHS